MGRVGLQETVTSGSPYLAKSRATCIVSEQVYIFPFTLCNVFCSGHKRILALFPHDNSLKQFIDL
jgi:hypothetical protein